MPSDGVHTAFILHLMNGIADATNGVSSGDNHPKRIPWTENSYHEQFLKDAVRQLKNMRFVDSETKKQVKTDIPCLQNMIDTLNGFQLVWTKLKSLGFKSFNTRNINQDPLENFFGNIKSHDFRSNKPTCYQFESTFKSLLITNLTSKYSPGYNCEQDGGQFVLDDCNTLLSGTEYLPNEEVLEEYAEHEEPDFIGEDQVIEQNHIELVPEKILTSCNSNDILKILHTKLPILKSCSECINSFTKQSTLRKHNTCFQFFHSCCKKVLGKFLKDRINFKKLSRKCVTKLKRTVHNSFSTCKEHRGPVFQLFWKVVVEKYILSTTTLLNRVLCGRIIPKFKKYVFSPLRIAHESFLKTVKKNRRIREGMSPGDITTSMKHNKTKKFENKVDGINSDLLAAKNSIRIKNSKKNNIMNIEMEAKNAIPLGKRKSSENKCKLKPIISKPLEKNVIHVKEIVSTDDRTFKSKNVELKFHTPKDKTKKTLPFGEKRKLNDQKCNVKRKLKEMLQNSKMHVEEIVTQDDPTSTSIQLHITEDANLESQLTEIEMLLLDM